jgi:hypothetical protein
MPRPIVPAPMTDARWISAGRASALTSGIRPHSRSAKKTCRSARDSRESSVSAEICVSRSNPLSKGNSVAARMARTTACCVVRPFNARAARLNTAFDRHGVELWSRCAAVCGTRRGVRRDQLARISHGFFDDVVADDCIDEPDFEGTRGGDRRAIDEHLERTNGAHQARQSLRSAGAGHQAERDFGHAHPRRCRGASIVARPSRFRAHRRARCRAWRR